jgi:thioredoxin 1
MAFIVTDENYSDLINGDKPVVLDFWAEWCAPCRMVSPFIDELATEYEGRVVIGKVDVDDNNDITTEYGIRNIPTILFFKGGELVDKQVGAAGKSVFVEKIDRLL